MWMVREVYPVSAIATLKWPQHFLPFLLTASSSSLGKKKIGTAHKQETEWKKQ